MVAYYRSAFKNHKITVSREEVQSFNMRRITQGYGRKFPVDRGQFVEETQTNRWQKAETLEAATRRRSVDREITQSTAVNIMTTTTTWWLDDIEAMVASTCRSSTVRSGQSCVWSTCTQLGGLQCSIYWKQKRRS